MSAWNEFDEIEDILDDDAGPHKKRGYVLVGFDGGFEADAARYALKLVSGARVFRRVARRDGFRDDSVLSLFGLRKCSIANSGNQSAFPSFKPAMCEQVRRLGSPGAPRCRVLSRNITKLGGVVKLTTAECAVLTLAVLSTRAAGFSDLLGLASLGPGELARTIAKSLGLAYRAVTKALSPRGKLSGAGFFESHRMRFADGNPLGIQEQVCDALLSPRFEIETFLRHVVRKGIAPRLTLTDYAHVHDMPLLRRYLADSIARRRKGVNVLLYGAPGTGKTECVRALAAELKLDLYEVPNEDAEGDPIDGSRRFASFAICQKIVGGRRRQLLLFDEVEDVFGSGADFWLRNDLDSPRRRVGKSWTNEILETNPVPTVWVCNDIGAMDPAYLRRFDMVLELPAPGPAVMRGIIARYFKPGEISDACVERLVSMESLPPAQVERVARVARSLRCKKAGTRDTEVERLVSASLRAAGLKCSMAGPALPAYYDPAFVNADRDLDSLAQGLGNHGGRLCLYGPPGTGKTAFAHHLGQLLKRPVLIKRSSDLLNMYVGGTERLIAEAFGQAKAREAILVIDEADGFLRDRSGASRNWEVTQVNELLTQMEAFEGIFIASTNLVDTLDEASLRRFDFKVKFGYLTRDQRRAMLARLATEATNAPGEDEKAQRAIDGLESLTPGDFANVLRQLRVTGEPPTPVRLAALLDAEAALKPEGRHRAMGFIH